ncbi:hypothetical protein [Actinomadura sp. 3N407]|uniref:hypothetical protein n=1 Tax=Actinomadura sp. 3N407 TaxID=3457423 RepID=UPI003FCCD9A1
MTASSDLSPAAAPAAAAGDRPAGALRLRAVLLVLLTFGAGTTDVVGFLAFRLHR